MEHIYNCIGHELKLPNIVRSQGVYIFDSNRKRYMDLESGVWCMSLGHTNRRVNETISNQIDSIIQSGFSYSSPIVEIAAERVLRLTELDGGKCIFLCSGSEAIEIGRQISKHLTGKPLSMTLQDSYLGAYSSVSDRSTGWYLFDWSKCTNCHLKDNCSRDCPLLKQVPDGISEFIFEPGSSSGFVRFPPGSLIQNLTEIVRENGGKILVNEVTTGIGRTGKWFGYQHYGITPDLIAIGKGIGNGYPVSVAVLSESVINDLETKPFRYSQSHQNDPLGASVAKVVIDIIEETDLISKALLNGIRFKKQLEQLIDGEILKEIRGRGLMMAIDVFNQKLTGQIHSKLMEQGYIVGNRGSLLRIDPPLIISEDEINGFIEAFTKIVHEIRVAI